ncbi:MAG TPA: alpha/beta hydrolase-fold protein [Gemmatimonadaceae bacterium]|nr:alpha/beta hydrolase-fold protein [Gemmatimonadaceae bacterium]
MELLVFGHAGARVIAFPTSQGRFFEWEDRGMVGALGEQLDRGWIQLYCVDSVDAESWYAKHVHPHWRARRHEAYERYVLDEVIPLTNGHNANPYLMVAGASFGAYHALNIALRHPWRFGRVIALSGLYDIKKMTGGWSDDAVYFQNPMDYLVHEHDAGRLKAIRRLDIILAIGGDDPSRPNNDHVSGLLGARGIPHRLRIWDGWCHDWPYWQRMIAHYIGGND